MNVRVDRAQAGFAQQHGIDHRLRRHAHVVIIGLAPERHHPGKILGEKLRHGRKRHAVHLVDDGLVVRRRHLATVLEVGLVAVVVRRIVTGRDDHPAMRLIPADGKTQLRGRARALKNGSLAAQLDPGGRSQFAEMPGEMPHIVRDDDLGPGGTFLRRQIFLNVAVKTDRGPHEREIVHHVTADTRVFRRTKGIQGSGLGFGWYDSDGTSAHATGAKLKVAIETVVQLRPDSALHQFGHALGRPSGQAALPPRGEIFHRGGQ